MMKLPHRLEGRSNIDREKSCKDELQGKKRTWDKPADAVKCSNEQAQERKRRQDPGSAMQKMALGQFFVFQLMDELCRIVAVRQQCGKCFKIGTEPWALDELLYSLLAFSCLAEILWFGCE